MAQMFERDTAAFTEDYDPNAEPGATAETATETAATPADEETGAADEGTASADDDSATAKEGAGESA
jgi:hypothetical protein